MVHTRREPSDDDVENEALYHIVKSDKDRSAYAFHKSGELCFAAFGPRRNPPLRFSITRLRDWEPDIKDLLILNTSNSTDIVMLASTTAAIASDQEAIHDYAIAGLLDNRRAAVPQMLATEDDSMPGDSVSIGEALDLSSTEKILRPIPMMEEIAESPTPLPAFLVLNHEGILSGWWIVWDKSIQAGTGYPGLIALGENEPKSTTPAAKALAAPQTTPGFAQPTFSVPTASQPSSTPGPAFEQPTQSASTFGATSGPAFGATSAPAFGASTFGKPSAPSFGTSSPVGAGMTGFGKPSAPAFGTASPVGAGMSSFGKPSAPSFGTASPVEAGMSSFGKPSAPSFGTASPVGAGMSSFGKPSAPAFGTASPAGAGTTSFGKPSAPAFGAASAVGSAAKPAFGAIGGIGGGQSPWGSNAQKPASSPAANPFASAASAPSALSALTQKPNPFSTAANSPSPFGKPAEPAQNPFSSAAGATSAFGKIGAGAPATGSPFSSFSSANGTSSPFTGLGQQKSAFSGTKNEPSSFGSTVDVGSGTGSTLPSWANTPAQPASVLGQGNSSFASNTSTQASDMSDAADGSNRERDEATPTPQAPKPSPFGMPTNGFKLGSTFKGDGSAKDDLPKPVASTGSSMFGNNFASAIGESSSTPPATPIKTEEEEVRLQDISTTPASPPKPLFPTTTPAKAPPVKKESPIIDDAPLPPDPMTWKPKKSADDDLPPLAGSPGVQVEAPESSVPSSPLDDDDDDDEDEDEDDFLVEEEDGDDEIEEPSPSDAARKSRTPKAGFSFQDSSRFQEYPPAPTPPVQHSRPPSQSGRSTAPARPLQFNQTPKPSTSSMFTTSATPGGFPQALQGGPHFAPPSNRKQANMRSPSPSRPTSTSTPGPRPNATAPRASFQDSMRQQSKPPTPQPEVSDLSDNEDERIRQELSREIVPKRTLDTFIAHQDYTAGSPSKTGHAAQIEIIYRDINSMVDTLGLNSRSLAAFIKYHSDARQDRPTRDDLEDAEDQGLNGPWFDEWRISELESMSELVTNLEADLSEGRVQDVPNKMSQLSALLNRSAKLTTKLNDIRRQIINRKDPEKAEALRKASLPKELAEQQKALRTEYAKLLSHIGQGEEAMLMLKSKLAAHHGMNGKTGAVPTVDAIKRTIQKMIQLTEKRNNDIMVLESQLRKIGLGDNSHPTSSFRTPGTPSRSSRALRNQSPFATPPTNKSGRMSLAELNKKAMTPEQEETTPSRGYGLFYTPEGSPTSGDSLARLANKMDDESLIDLRETAQRRKKLAKGFADAVLRRGVKITSIA
jgi:nucleoporin NUP159